MRCSKWVRCGFLVSVIFSAACSAPGNFQGDDDAAQDDASSPADDAGNGSNDATATQDSGGGTKDAATKPDSGTVQDAGGTQDSGNIIADSGDGFSAARTACVNEINKLRATENHAAYKLWETTAIDTCVDEQATFDQKANSAHDAWINNKYPTCNGNAQDECLGYGNSPSEVVACLDSMWAEKNQSNCSTCAQCNGKTLTQTIVNCFSTSTCDFYGNYGSECGHYVNMAADYFTEVACGFSTVGTSHDWATQNFQ